jgi:hypothetical protein
MIARTIAVGGRRVPGVLRDKLELNHLAMLEDQREVMARIRAQTKAGMRSIAGIFGRNGTAEDEAEEDGVGGIENRTRRIHKSTNNQAARSDGPWVALILLVAIGAIIAWMSTRPVVVQETMVPVSPIIQPANPVVPMPAPREGIDLKVIPPDPPLFQ